jgi:hypothetical protein
LYVSASGAVLRITPDGEIPPDNPFVGEPGMRPDVFTVGHRRRAAATSACCSLPGANGAARPRRNAGPAVGSARLPRSLAPVRRSRSRALPVRPCTI